MSQITITATNDNASGAIQNHDNVWATCRNATTGTTASPGDANNTASAWLTSPGATYFINRGFMTFALSSIPTGSQIISVTFQGYMTDVANVDSDTLYIVESSQSSSLVVADFNNFTFTSLGTIVLASIVDSQYNDITLNSTGIALVQTKIGSTLKLADIMGKDFNNSAPSGNSNNVFIKSAASATPPKLVITYTPPGAFIFNLI